MQGAQLDGAQQQVQALLQKLQGVSMHNVGLPMAGRTGPGDGHHHSKPPIDGTLVSNVPATGGVVGGSLTNVSDGASLLALLQSSAGVPQPQQLPSHAGAPQHGEGRATQPRPAPPAHTHHSPPPGWQPPLPAAFPPRPGAAPLPQLFGGPQGHQLPAFSATWHPQPPRSDGGSGAGWDGASGAGWDALPKGVPPPALVGLSGIWGPPPGPSSQGPPLRPPVGAALHAPPAAGPGPGPQLAANGVRQPPPHNGPLTQEPPRRKLGPPPGFGGPARPQAPHGLPPLPAGDAGLALAHADSVSSGGSGSGRLEPRSGAQPNGRRRVQGRGPRPPPAADMASVSAALRALAASLQPSAEEVAAQRSAFERVAGLLRGRWPSCGVCLFGSAANGLSIAHNNDLDVCLELPGLPEEGKAEVVEAMGVLAQREGMLHVQALAAARVPVCKFVVPGANTCCDVTVNNSLACLNTQLLAAYGHIDERLRQLVFVVKHWAKRRSVNDAYRGSLSSYAYVLMCIHILQTRQPPILPCLQQGAKRTVDRQVGAWRVSFDDDVGPLQGWGAANRQEIAELLLAFFEYWAWEHDYHAAVVSVRVAGLLTKRQKGWTQRVGSERHLICIEDPFQLDHDLGRCVDRNTSRTLQREFQRAATILRADPDPLHTLFKPWTPDEQ